MPAEVVFSKNSHVEFGRMRSGNGHKKAETEKLQNRHYYTLFVINSYNMIQIAPGSS